MKKIEKLYYPCAFISPIIFALSWILIYLLIGFLFRKSIDSIGAVLGLIIGMIIELGYPIMVFLIGVPLYCLMYGTLYCLTSGIKNTISSKKKFFLVFYNSLILSLFCYLSFSKDEKAFRYALILFVWSLFWCILPILFNFLKNKANK